VTTGAVRLADPPPLRLFRLKNVATVALCAAAAFAAWTYLAPPQVGGSTSFAIVDGTSMLPHLRRDDLVLLRRAPSYTVGDVVAYHSTLIHRVVLHRIVAIHQGRYTFKGDNNSFLDPEQPTRGALIGKRWVVVPRAGRFVGLLRTPIIAALFAGVLVLLFGFAGAQRLESTET
jgi:signal peptidase I